MIKKLGSEFLGLNSLFISIIQVLNLTELGIGSSLIYSMYKPIAEDDIDTLGSMLNFYKIIYRFIGCVIAVIGVVLIPILPYIVNMDELLGTGINLYVLYLIYLLNTVISYFFFSYRKSLLTAYQRQDIISNINSLVHLMLYASQLLVLVAYTNYYIYTILMPVFTVLDNLFVAVITNKKFPQIIKNKCNKPTELKAILGNTRYIVGHKIGAVMIQSADSIVISAFLNLSILTIYGNYYYVISALIGFINVGYNAILAGVGNSIITKSKKQIYDLFLDLSFLIFFIIAFCTSSLLSLYQPFMKMWMGIDYLLPMNTVVLFSIYFYVWQIRVIGLNFKDAAGMWKDDWLKPYVGIVFNIILNITLVVNIGVDGVILATIFVMSLIYFPCEIFVLHKHLFQTTKKNYMLRQVLYFIITAIVSTLTYFITDQIKANGIIGLLVKAVVTFLCSALFLFLSCYWMPELKNILQRVKTIWKRKRH
ncbi:lipopolysaccharide biosynthesis protein [Sedimentibacter saalensis]|nr:polysaccharide biosynthesis protein [Sedimentibacter saalensis]